MRITIDLRGIEGVREQFARLGNAPQQALDVTSEKLEDYVNTQTAPHTLNSARTRGSKAMASLEHSLGKTRIPGGWEIGHDSRVSPYARFVHDGTPAHDIKPKPGSGKKAIRYARDGIFWFWFGPQESKQQKAMIFQWVKKKYPGGNTRVIFKWPHHPGSKPDKWMERAAMMAPLIFKEKLNAIIKAG